MRLFNPDLLAFLNMRAFHRNIGVRNNEGLVPTSLSIVLSDGFPDVGIERLISQQPVGMLQAI
jgi:hypothetical protein